MITEREFLERARLDRATLSIWIEEEWLIPGRTAHELAFTDMDLARANLIHDLKDKMGVNDEGLGVIVRLPADRSELATNGSGARQSDPRSQRQYGRERRGAWRDPAPLDQMHALRRALADTLKSARERGIPPASG